MERFDLVDMAEDLGVEVILLDHGLDLEQLARDAVARGADCLGMAGGDGSQALVASIAVEHDLPFVCITAGTRNHFALDLGLDKEDPRTGMVAFRDGVERLIDYATVGDRLFVNNVSLGVYATIVQQESYRDAKTGDARRSCCPSCWDAQAEPFDLQFTHADGTEVDGAFLILVSNNPYVLGPTIDISQRRSTDRPGSSGCSRSTPAPARGRRDGRPARRWGCGRRDPNIHEFTTETLRGPVPQRQGVRGRRR